MTDTHPTDEDRARGYFVQDGRRYVQGPHDWVDIGPDDTHPTDEDREALARAIDPHAFEDHPIERKRAIAALQWAARRKFAQDAADAALAWFASRPSAAQTDDTDTLRGATDPGDPAAWPADAGQFAARWNAADPSRRNSIVQLMQTTAGEAETCFIRNHEQRIADLAGALSAARAEVAALRAAHPTREQIADALAPFVWAGNDRRRCPQDQRDAYEEAARRSFSEGRAVADRMERLYAADTVLALYGDGAS